MDRFIPNNMRAKYDDISTHYNATRKADNYLVERLWHHLNPKPNGLYLDIGCGTGNYTNKLQRKGYRFIGVDPSKEMLEKAKLQNPNVEWKLGQAETLSLDSKSIDGIMGSLTIHHWAYLEKGFTQLHRVLKTTGNLVIFTSTPKQMAGYWLNHYFPKMMKDSMLQMPALETVKGIMTQVGFATIKTELYSIKPDLKDLFLYSGKHHPKLYLNPHVRQGISSFSSLAHADEVEMGLQQLEADIKTQKIDDIIKSYENDLGDYLFIIGSNSQ
ncbi:class I SAM-dependent methyltransferase [Hwangdonia seohaensis]